MESHIKTWSTAVKSEEKKIIPCAICGSLKFKPSLSCEGFNYVRCARCSLVQMNPQPVKKEVMGRYLSEDYLKYELANEENYLNLQLLALNDTGFNKLEKGLFSAPKSPVPVPNPPLSAPRILDLGCATGSLLSLLGERGWETTGVEICKAQADHGRKMRQLNISELPLEDNNFSPSSFNVVLASHVIEHLNDPASFVREVHRILIPGGSFFVTTPNIDGFQARLFGKHWRSAIFDHLYLFSIKTLRQLLEDAGFITEKTVSWGGLAAGSAPAPVKRLFDRTAKRFGFGDVVITRSRKNSEI